MKSLREKLNLLTARLTARRKASKDHPQSTFARPDATREAAAAEEIGRATSTRSLIAKPVQDVPQQSTPATNAASRARGPRSLERWRYVDIPLEHDIRLRKPPSLPRGERFETAEDVAEYDAIRIAGLMNARPDLAAEIERREEGVVFPSTPISARDARDFRVADIAERLRIAGEYEGPHEIATIYLGAYPAGRLDSFDLTQSRWSLRKKLGRAGFGDAILTGGTEVAWIDRLGLWIPHRHLLSIHVPPKAWDSLREMQPDGGPAVALKIQVLADLPDQLSYCQKFNSTHMPGKRGPTDRAPAKPLPRERLVEWAAWMFKYSFEEFGFHYRCRRRGGHIVPDA